MKHRFNHSNGDWACERCHRWMSVCRGMACNPAKEHARLRKIVERARKTAKR